MDQPPLDDATDVLEMFEELPLRLGLGTFMHPTEERLRLIKQLGVDDIDLNMYQNPLTDTNYEERPLPGAQEWSYENLVRLRERVEAAGLRLNALEVLPFSHYDKIVLGKDGRDEQLEHVKNTIRNMGRAGIPTLGYLWNINGVWRTSTTSAIRGGAQTMAVDMAELEDAPLTHDRKYTEAEFWDNYEYFLKAVLPVAEEAGVTLALHPDDPPTDVAVGGLPRLFRNFQNFKHAMNLVESDSHGLLFCLGNWSEMGADIFEAIEYFGERDKLEYVHFQTVSGPLPQFHETFIDQEGYYDPYKVLAKLREVGFSGMINPGHVPRMEGDGDWKERGRAFTIGYLKGLLTKLRHVN